MSLLCCFGHCPKKNKTTTDMPVLTRSTTRWLGRPRFALLIGINYTGFKDAELNGCINDAHAMEKFLEYEHVTLITDETDPKPTRFHILEEIRRLLVDAKEANAREVFIHYSGHGSYDWDFSGDEKDNQDESLVPLDYLEEGMIMDDELADMFVRYPLPNDCRCVCLFDCCHSGTMLDLPFRYLGGTRFTRESHHKFSFPIITISGCRDNQTSADAIINSKWAGAMSKSFLESMQDGLTVKEVLRRMRLYLQEHGFDQVPQVCYTEDILDYAFMESSSTKDNTIMNRAEPFVGSLP